jgi:hypothetical protein
MPDTKWEVQLKGDLGNISSRETPTGYELSVIRADSGHGHASWGWGGDDKIILFSSGTGGNPTRDPEFAMWVATSLCHSLNKATTEDDIVYVRHPPGDHHS